MPTRSPAPVRIGLRIEPSGAPAAESPGSPAGPGVDPALVDAAADMEAAGLDVLWIAERPTHADALVPSALLCCAAVAARTRRMHVATGLLPLPLHHPLRVAEDAASLDLVSGGRFELGLGLGSDPGGLAHWGVARGDRSERFHEAVDLVQRAFTGDATRFQGRHFQLDGIRVTPQPATPGGPPLWIGAVRPEGQELAARLGAGLMLPAAADPRPYLEAWARTAEARAGASRRAPPSRPRLAWLLGPPEGAYEQACRARDAAAGADCDLVLGPASPDALARHVDALRRIDA